MGDQGEGVCPVVSSDVAAGVGGPGHVQTMLLFISDMCSVEDEGAGAQHMSNHTMVWSNHALVWSNGRAQGIRRWAQIWRWRAARGVKKACLGGIGPMRGVRAGLEREDAQKTPECGTSIDRGHRDLSVHAQMRGVGTPGLGREGCKRTH